jgi:hypothetical protein
MNDAENTVISVKKGADVRGLRTTLIELSYALAQESPEKKRLLLLIESRITPERLEKEWRSAEGVLQPDVANRLSVVLSHGGRFVGFPVDPEPDLLPKLESLARELHGAGTQVRRIDAYNEVLKILVYRWLLHLGPITMIQLGRMAGYSFPTIYAAVRKLGNSVVRRTGKGIELTSFPHDEWAKMVAVADSARSTVRFADRSGQPRSPEALLRRFQQLAISDVAVGGVFGARHHHADLDLVGSPRLDLTIHAPKERMDLSFAKPLDPGLEVTEDPREFSSLTTHVIRRRVSLFEKGADGALFADPVECLLDLHEMRFEPQAKEFLQALIARRESRRE